jgi:carboxylate-amine ligase
LEYMLVDRQSLDVRAIADTILPKAQQAAKASSDVTDIHGAINWSNELALHVIEIKNLRPGPLAGLSEAFQKQITALDTHLARANACLMPSAMHPWMDPTRETKLWPYDDEEIYATYHRLFNCNRHAWSNVQSMHVNLPFADDQQFEKLIAAVRLVLPLLPAIAASSPIADGVPSAYMDHRMHVYRGQAPSQPAIVGAIVPEVVRSRSEQETCVLEPMFAEIEPEDPEHRLRFEWLNSRGAIPRFDRHAVEIRVMDMQECPQADLALAALVIDLTQLFYGGEFSHLDTQQAVPTQRLSEILMCCSRDADQTMIDDAQYLSVLQFPGSRCSAQELWYHLGETLLSHGAAHAPLWQSHLKGILEHGPLARRIVRALNGDTSHAALHAVYANLVGNLREGKPFFA